MWVLTDDKYYKTIHIHEEWIRQAELIFRTPVDQWPNWAPLLLSSL